MVMDSRLNAGVYAIINKPLNLVYIGKTEQCFVLRWIQHIKGTPDYFDNYERSMLYLHKGTKWIVLKELAPFTEDRGEFYRFEQEARDFYRAKGWTVLSTHQENIENTHRKKEEDLIQYKKAIQHMVGYLGNVEVKEKYIAQLYHAIYRKVNRHFETDVFQREGNSRLDTLTKEEIEFVLLDTFPRYAAKIRAIHQKEYQSESRQLHMHEM